MSLFDSESPIGYCVNGVYGALSIPVRAIIQAWSHANPRDKGHLRNGSARRRSYDRERSAQIDIPLAFDNSNAQRYTYATSRKRLWKGSNRLEGPMSSPNNKRRKTHHIESTETSSPWEQEGWAQNSRSGIEALRLPKKQATREKYSGSSRGEFVNAHRLSQYGTPDRNNFTNLKSFGRSRFTQSSPPASLARTPKPVFDFSSILDSSSDDTSRNKRFRKIENYRVREMELKKEKPVEEAGPKVPDQSKDNAMANRSKYSLSVQPPLSFKWTPPLSPDYKGDRAGSEERDEEGREKRRHDGNSQNRYTDNFRGFSPSPSPEPEVIPRNRRVVEKPVMSRNKVRTFFGKQSDPVQNSPGAFPQTESDSSSQDCNRDASSDEADTSKEQPKRLQSPDVPQRPNSRHAAYLRRHSISQSYTPTRGFIGGAKSVLDAFVSPFKPKTDRRPPPTDVPDLSSLKISSRRPKSDIWSHSKTHRQTREQKLREEREAALARGQYALEPLSDEWDRKVRQAVRQGTPDGKYSPSDFARVVPEYASPPQNSSWLNDAVINDYVALVARHGNKDDRKDQTPTFAALSSFFYAKLAQDPKNAPASWTRRAKIPGKALLDCTMIFIPINEGAHWTLCVIEPKDKRRITMYNSMGHGRNASHAKNVLAWVRHHLGAAFVEDEWTVNARGVSPQQNNMDDCGVFTCTTARQLMLGQMEKTPYDHTIMQVQRKRMIAELLNNGLLKANEE